MSTKKIPPFDDLPLGPGDPSNSAWGMWADSKTPELGSLNHLTDDVVLAAAKNEIQFGERVGLKYVI